MSSNETDDARQNKRQAPQQSSFIKPKMIDVNQNWCIDLKHNLHVTLQPTEHPTSFEFLMSLSSLSLWTCGYTRIFAFSIKLASSSNDRQIIGSHQADSAWWSLTVAEPDKRSGAGTQLPSMTGRMMWLAIWSAGVRTLFLSLRVSSFPKPYSSVLEDSRVTTAYVERHLLIEADLSRTSQPVCLEGVKH
jgi:hypothetical protein